MKIIGEESTKNYIAIISHDEIEKVLGKYYGKLDKSPMIAGYELDLGNGYNFRQDIVNACDQMRIAMEQFRRAQETLMQFALMVGKLEGTK